MNQTAVRPRLLAALFSALIVLAFVRPASADLNGPLANAVDLMMKGGSYHFDMTSGAGASAETSSGDVASFSPMRMQSVMNMGGGAGKMEMIILPTASYMKMGNEGWKKMPGVAASFSQMDMAGMMAKNRAESTVTDLGMRLKDGAMLHAYRVTNNANKTTETVYLDGAGHITRAESADFVMRFSKFGQPVHIVAPM